MTVGPQKSISVIINTDGRAASLRETIEALRRIDYAHFEVCVVCGPTPDGTRELAAEFRDNGWIKVAHCEERNLSMSRNIGIAMSAGDIVAFIDDDAIPDRGWLTEIAAAYADPEVKSVGGEVLDHTGYTYQYHYAACDRLGNAILDLKEPAHNLNVPFGGTFPYVQGTNSSFERESLVYIGGFDEEYEFYLDETDVCCRFVDAGLFIRQIPGALVHHKYLPSSIRNSDKVTVVKFPVIKNKIYFSFANNHGHFTTKRALEDALRFIDEQRNDLEFHVRGGRLPGTALEEFEIEAEAALRHGLSRGLSGRRRTRDRAYFANPGPFLPFSRLMPGGGKRVIVFLSQNYPPTVSGGNARHTADIAQGIADLGHDVHVITRGEEYNRVDLERGVWVHRIVDKDQLPEKLPGGNAVPKTIWNHSRTVLEEIDRINCLYPIDAIEAPTWDCEQLAALLDGRYPVVTNVVTTICHWLETHQELRNDANWMERFGDAMLEADKLAFAQSDMLLVASDAIANSTSEIYGYDLKRQSRLAKCVHGLVDMRDLARRRPKGLPRAAAENRITILFVGRLELRKGIDILLEAVPDLIREFPALDVWIAGDDTLVVDGRLTAREIFEARYGTETAGRVRFLGRVDEDELRWLYASCDIFTSPSRFESFGLIFVEAMMFSKPSVAIAAGGVPEVVEDGETGLLIEQPDTAQLQNALRQLIADSEFRTRLGTSARSAFEAKFDVKVVAPRRVELLSALARRTVDRELIDLPESAKVVVIGNNGEGHLLAPETAISIDVSRHAVLNLVFWAHPWSGIAEVASDHSQDTQTIDLYHASGSYRSLKIDVLGNESISITRSGQKNAQAHDSEVIFCFAQTSQ